MLIVLMTMAVGKMRVGSVSLAVLHRRSAKKRGGDQLDQSI